MTISDNKPDFRKNFEVIVCNRTTFFIVVFFMITIIWTDERVISENISNKTLNICTICTCLYIRHWVYTLVYLEYITMCCIRLYKLVSWRCSFNNVSCIIQVAVFYCRRQEMSCEIIGILRGYAIRSGRRPEGSQRPQGGPAADFPRDVCLTVSRNHAVFLLSSTNI